jgi:GT2 family glycosyltransferase
MNTFRASIVVLCYNGLRETTLPCLESIVANTSGESYELIVVDNASVDGTAEYLKTFAAEHANVRIQLNDINKGYAAGNNDGIRLARGRYVVLLNNDTLVPCEWLPRLLKLFKEQPNIGMVGPVTNSAGNEQRIDLPGLNEKNFEEMAAAYIERQKGVWFTTEKLGFFCVAIRRTLLEKIGFLDEKFGLGMFEDDDYCLRAKKAGFSLGVVEDCFVYHKGSVSFGKLAVTKYRALFEENRAYFRLKNGFDWAFTDIAFSYWEKFDGDLLAYAKSSKETSPEIERILVRHKNFKHLLVQIHQAELVNLPTNVHGSSSQIATRAKWYTRWSTFKRFAIYGTPTEKLRYIRRILNGILTRFGIGEGTGELREGLAKLKILRKKLTGQKLVIFPATVDFHFMAQRPQHLARAFAEAGYLVIYGTLNHQIDKVDIIEQVSDNLYLLNEHYFAFISHIFKPEECIYYCLWPNNIKHLRHLPYSYLLYDYMDQLSLLDLPADELERDHLAMLNHADIVTVSSEKLMDQLPKKISSKTLLINNAVSKQFIDAVNTHAKAPIELETFGDHPILGYYGAIDEWMDFDLLECLAKEITEARLVLIGPIAESVTQKVEELLQYHSNVVAFPVRKQLELIPFLQKFDICLIPFIKNPVTDAISPVKLFEYFSAGKPVVTTNLAECVKYTLIHVAYDHRQFVELVRNILLENPRNLNVTAQQVALNNTWKHRVQQILSVMQLKVGLPET